MNNNKQHFSGVFRVLKQAPDEIMMEIGAGGELLASKIRLVCASLLVLMPIANYFLSGINYESMAGTIGACSAVLLSALWLKLAKKSTRRNWLAFLSTALDVTMVSLVLIILAIEDPVAGLNSVTVWCCYPLAIFATALRNNVRVTLFSGLLAIAQFGLLAMLIMSMSDEPLQNMSYGTVSVSTQVQRVVLLIAVTALTAMVVSRMQRLVQLSGTDTLTGLPNRLYLNHRVPQLIAQASAQKNTLCLVIIDLDLFKRVNDELGHLAGDRAIRHVVNILRSESSREEPLIRMGGEEFLLVVNAPMGNAWERMESLRKRVEAQAFDPGNQKPAHQLTFSAGIACHPHDAGSVSALLKVADQRLKIAKSQGRNRVIARD